MSIAKHYMSRRTVQDIPFSQGSPLSRPSGDTSVGESMLSSLWTDRCGVSCGWSLDFFISSYSSEIHLPSSWSLARLLWKLEERGRRVVVRPYINKRLSRIRRSRSRAHLVSASKQRWLQKRKGADVSVGPLEPQRSHPFPNEECSADHVCWRYPTGAKLRPGPCTGSTHACHQISSVGGKIIKAQQEDADAASSQHLFHKPYHTFSFLLLEAAIRRSWACCRRAYQDAGRRVRNRPVKHD